MSKAIPLIHPAPIAIIGTTYKDKVNFTTIGDLSVAGLNPALVVVSVHKNHMATNNIYNSSSFSINMATSSMIDEVIFAGTHSGSCISKSELLNYEIYNDVPLVEKSMISLIVSARDKVIIENRVILICDVINTFVDDSLLSGNVLNLKNASSIVYGLDDCFYELAKRYQR